MNRYKITIIVIALLVMTFLGLSFTTVNKGSYKNSLYYRFTRQRFAWLVGDPRPKHAIQAGWANATIFPTATAPASKAPSLGDRDPIQTRVIVLDNGTTRAAMITVNLLKMPPTVAQELEKRLPKIGFPWKNVYLGATYSQPGPGGWARDYMGQRTSGPYNQERVNRLTEAILKAVTSAQKNVSTVQIGYSQVDLTAQNQPSSDSSNTGNNPLQLLKLQKPTGESALIFAGYIRPIPADKSDFLPLLTKQLEAKTRCFTLGLVGSVQDASRLIKAGTSNRPVDQVTNQIATLVANQSLRTDSTLVAQTTPLIQNDPQIRVSQNLRLKPWLAKALYGDYPAELKALRIGKTVFVGCPGGISTELVDDLLTLPVANQRKLVITSYNGGDIGQFVPDNYYYTKESPYALDQINRFGPYTATFFKDMTQSLVSSLK